MEASINVTLDHVLFLGRRFHRDNVQSVILVILLELHIPSYREGFQYLRKAIELNCKDPSCIYLRELYEQAAPDVGYNAADQAVRRVIDMGFKDGDEQVWNYYFPPGPDGVRRRPSNADFICTISRVVELWQSCAQEVAYEYV